MKLGTLVLYQSKLLNGKIRKPDSKNQVLFSPEKANRTGITALHFVTHFKRSETKKLPASRPPKQDNVLQIPSGSSHVFQNVLYMFQPYLRNFPHSSLAYCKYTGHVERPKAKQTKHSTKLPQKTIPTKEHMREMREEVSRWSI
jgi:hypothetical protein